VIQTELFSNLYLAKFLDISAKIAVFLVFMWYLILI